VPALRAAQRHFEEAVRPWLGRVDWPRVRVAVGLGICGLAALFAWRASATAASGRPDEADALFVYALVIGFVGLLTVDARSLPPREWTWSQRPWGVGLVVIGVAAVLVATALQMGRVPVQIVTLIWLVSLVAVACGVAMIDRAGIEARFVHLAALAAVMFLALALRLVDLANVPSYVSFDEAVTGNQARLILAGGISPVFGLGWENLPALAYATHAATVAIFGDNLFGLRMSSLLCGMLSIGLLYLLARRLWGSRVALLASVLFAFSAWHIHFSRAGIHEGQAPFAILLAAYLLVRGLQDRSVLALVLAGFALGASFELYTGARLAGVLVAVYLIYRAVFERGFLRTHARRLPALLIGAAVFIAPMVIVWSRTPDGFAVRSRVNILLPSNMSHSMNALHVDTVWDVLGHQLRSGLEVLAVRGVSGLWAMDHFGDPGPLLDPWTAGLVAVGLIAILLRPRSSNSVLLAAWLVLGVLLSAVLTVDQPDPGRMVAVLPAIVLVAALALDEIWRGATYVSGRIGNALAPVIVVVLLGLILHANVDDYFRVFPERLPATPMTLASMHAARMSDDYRTYLVGSGDWSFDNEVARYFAPNVEAVNVKDGRLNVPLERIPPVKGIDFLVEGSESAAEPRLAPIRAAYPGGVTEVVSQSNGIPAFVSYQVENSTLAAARPDAIRE
jgi:4-amino-4-deoxy-L-arabinose transferase-like glycosyltransferase